MKTRRSQMTGKYAKLFLLGILILSIYPLINSQGASQDAGVRQDLQYICPMHPHIMSKTAGTCSQCGMTLKLASDSPAAPPSRDVRWGPTYFPNVTLTPQDGRAVRFY